nr:MAG TPA: RecT protein [Caudoviricetes sp.]
MAVGNSLANRPQQKLEFGVYLTQDAAKNEINKVLGGQAGTRFISSIISAVQATPALAECTNGSILTAALQGEALKLSPSPQLGQYYLVPFNNKKKGCKEAQFQLGYKGYIQLAKRSGVYKKMNVMSIKEGELISYNPLEEELEVRLIEDDSIREETPTIGYYAMFEEVNGYRHSMYWSKKKMMAHADRFSAAFNSADLERLERGEIPEADKWKYSSFWYKDFDAMAHKTMLRQLISKWGTMSIDLVQAIDSDMAVIHADGTKEYVETDADIIAADQPAESPAPEFQEQETPSQETPPTQTEANVADDFFS